MQDSFVRLRDRLIDWLASKSDGIQGDPWDDWDGKTHLVQIWDVKPRPGEEQFDPYFIAMCPCGWIGTGVHSERESRSNALTHSSTVEDNVRYPLGGKPGIWG